LVTFLREKNPGVAVPEDLEELFNALLDSVLTLEIPNLQPLIDIYDFCGYSPSEIEENLQLVVGLMSETPLLAAGSAFSDLTAVTSLYPKGPNDAGCLGYLG